MRDVQSHVSPRPLATPLVGMPISRLVMAFALTIGRWEMRFRTRKALKKLDARLLQDVGLDREQARVEWDKPFWWD